MCDVNTLNKGIDYLFPLNKPYYISNYTGQYILTSDSNYNIRFVMYDNTNTYTQFYLDENYNLSVSNNLINVYISPDYCYAFFSIQDIPNQIKSNIFYFTLGGSLLTQIGNTLYKLYCDSEGSLRVSDNCNVEKYKIFLFGPPPLDNINFLSYCSSHDSGSSDPSSNSLGRPMFLSNHCVNYIYNSSNPADTLSNFKNQYCESYPLLHDCPSYCAPMLDNTGKIVTKPCTPSLDSLCNVSNMKYKGCKSYVSNKYVNKDDEISSYCSKLSDPLKEDLELCGCFMSTDYYKNFMKSIESDDIKVDYDISQQYCYFGPCAASTIKPYYYKTENPSCPDINACVTYSFENINVNGQIDSSNVIIIKNDCCDISANLSAKNCSSNKITTASNVREYYGTSSCNSRNYLFIFIGIVLFVLLLILFTKKK